ncbi:UDP-N-acetylmuramoyl-L-alanyl-D-glutamate synthetase [Pusillimonas sp. T7-7]|uniref:UDP-N-acetylmuramoyl-L-alanine--D-glutamate ligase n=1 Tax=Pusillimonas sp. (strain T7-7) TaxID=1007105 RepID=UPI0002085643|nr:UDP-N-acetylmuramoyl-L-alanine--D-glutamate ligase [Pusillimonas sp. T7-7]AEC18550.1 UDP-N-acetylmuramoyl-L-alanyl-D-glutamate synthetase [Pusillimonas sp. T7-7]
MNTMSFPSVRVDGLTLILGLGETGLAAALWCARQGARLRVLDTRAEPGGLRTLQQALDADKVDYRLGPNVLVEDALQDVHTIVLSPGLSPLQSPVNEFLALASQRDIEVIGEIELFARALADMADQGYQPKVLAITGTNGKTTVTAMTRQLVQASGHTAKVAGNISPAALTALSDALAADDLPEVWVLELSSFQLESVRTLSPDAAVVLNVTQDHLDWHGSMQAYAAAKARLLGMSRVAIVNRDDPLVMAMADDVKALAVRSFGRDMPVYEGDLGLERSNDMLWLAAAEANDFDLPAAPARRKKAAVAPQRPEGRPARLIPADALRVRGQHNALNALAALGLARSLGLGWAAMLHALRDYAGEAHRTEFVRAVAGVDFINDSKGTNVGATVAALDGMGAPVVLIAGGLAKGQDFSPLAAAVRAHARAVVLIGQDAGLIGQALAETGVPVEHAVDLGQAVARSIELAQPGDTVLLSPACASMDMFRNYGHRGSSFVDEVQELALSRGEVA